MQRRTFPPFIFIIVVLSLLISCQERKENSHTKVTPPATSVAEDTFILNIAKAKLTFPKKEIKTYKIDDYRDTVYINTKFDTAVKGNKVKALRFDFQTSIFINPVDIHRINFNDAFSFNTVVFHGPVEIRSCSFSADDPTGFDCYFFKSVQFDSSALFFNNTDSTNLVFDNCRFKGPLAVTGTDTSAKDLVFQFCQLDKGINFWNERRARIGDTGMTRTNKVFGRSLAFRNCNIWGKLDLSYSRFLDKRSISFIKTALPDTLDLSHAELNGPLDLTEVTPNRRNPLCQLILYGEDVKKIRFQYNHFRLLFPPAMTDDEVSSTYELVMKTMKENGFDDSYKKVDCEFRQKMVRRTDKDYSRTLLFKTFNSLSFGVCTSYINPILNRLRPGALIDTINRHWWNYGYQKDLILRWTVTFLLFFSLLNNFLYERLMKTYKVENLERKSLRYTPNPLLKISRYFLLSIMYTSFIFFKFGIDFKKVTVTNTRIFCIILVEYVIGLACTGFLLNWILKG